MPTLSKPRARVNWNAAPANVLGKKAKREQKISSVYTKGNDIAFAKCYEDFLPKCTAKAKPLF